MKEKAKTTELRPRLRAATLPSAWNRVLALAYCRLRNQSPIKCIQDDFTDSYLSQTLGTESLSAKTLSDFLKRSKACFIMVKDNSLTT